MDKMERLAPFLFQPAERLIVGAEKLSIEDEKSK